LKVRGLRACERAFVRACIWQEMHNARGREKMGSYQHKKSSPRVWRTSAGDRWAGRKIYVYITIHVFWLGGGVRLPSFWRRGDLPVFLFHILVDDKVQSSRIQASSPRAPARMYRVATQMMPNGQMRSCPGRAARQVSVLRRQPKDRDPGLPDVDWGTQ
jgi:hypothetical protein